jgi:flagellar secretion chaperone FliS
LSVYSSRSKLAAYQSTAVHGGVAGADPHRLVLMLMDGALERITIGRGCIERNGKGDVARKAAALNQCISIVGELRGTLDMSAGGELAENLNKLYDYMIRRLLLANVNNDVKILTEVASLLDNVRSAWAAIAPGARTPKPQAVPA